MEIKKLKIPQDKFDINLQFYFLLKQLVKSKINNNQIGNILELINLSKKTKNLLDRGNVFLESIGGREKKDILQSIFATIKTKIDLELLEFGLKLYSIKDLLLQEAKLKEVITTENLAHLDPLSLKYDNLTVKKPYSTRVNGALLSLLFFTNLENKKTNFMSKESQGYLDSLSSLAIRLKKNGIEPNQIFMLMFSESINQSIISDSGSNYEDRILSVLTRIGIPEDKIQTVHDKDDSSTEFDFFFDLNGRTYGIGAKRTLRERYKQFIKTAQMSKIDVMIEITLGMDLNETKAKAILNHGVYLFVSNEIYESRDFLKKMKGIYPAKDLTLDLLRKLK